MIVQHLHSFIGALREPHINGVTPILGFLIA